MQRIFALPLKMFWRITGPVRRPLLKRFDARVSRLVSDTVNARMMPTLVEALAASGDRLERIERSIASADRTATNLAEEVDLVLNGLSREIFRLQTQLDLIQRRLEEDSRSSVNGFSIINESGDPAPMHRPSASAERSRVG
jgi:hypothetical protein